MEKQEAVKISFVSAQSGRPVRVALTLKDLALNARQLERLVERGCVFVERNGVVAMVCR